MPRISVPGRKTHIPFGCSVVGVMWKPKASLNLEKKIFISRSVYGSWSAVCQNLPLVQWICTGLQICKRRFNPLYRATEVFFALFVTWLCHPPKFLRALFFGSGFTGLTGLPGLTC